jgi:hypothetical protein
MLRNGVDIFALQKLMRAFGLAGVVPLLNTNRSGHSHRPKCGAFLWTATYKQAKVMKSPFDFHKSVPYNCTHFDNNMSINVKNALPRIDKLRQIMKSRTPGLIIFPRGTIKEINNRNNLCVG